MSSSEIAFAFFCFSTGICVGTIFTILTFLFYSFSSKNKRALAATNAECDAGDALDPLRIAVARGDTRSQLTEESQRRIRDQIVGRIRFADTHHWADGADPFRGFEVRFKSPKQKGG